MSSQSWVWNAVTGQYDWRPGKVAPPGSYLNPPCSPEENSTSARPVSNSQAHPAPGPAGSDLGSTLPISNLSTTHTPRTFTYWPSTNSQGLTSTPSQAIPWSIARQPDLPINHPFPALIPSEAAPLNEVPQAGTQTERSSSPAFPYTLPPPSPPSVPAHPTTALSQPLDMFLPPPSPPANFAHPTRASSKTTLVETRLPNPTEQRKHDASSSTLARCHCCLRNPVSFRKLGVNWCNECFEMVQSRRQR